MDQSEYRWSIMVTNLKKFRLGLLSVQTCTRISNSDFRAFSLHQAEDATDQVVTIQVTMDLQGL